MDVLKHSRYYCSSDIIVNGENKPLNIGFRRYFQIELIST